MQAKPNKKPNRPLFSSGPCPKPITWTASELSNAIVGRSHRSKIGRQQLQHALSMTRELLQLPDDYLLALVPGSDTGAFELAMWSLLGQRGVDVLAFESFGKDWLQDIKYHLKLKDVNFYEAPYGELPNLLQVNPHRDVVFVWNGTTSGVRIPNGEWIADNRQGLTLCDATSAIFAMKLPWTKLDVITYSWQKVLGGEAAHGMLILSPRAVERLETYQPPWPIPKLFRLTTDKALKKDLFEGATINTPSMLCVEDYLFSLNWAQSAGGLSGLIERTQKNYELIQNWVQETNYIDFLAKDFISRSSTSVCLRITDQEFVKKTVDMQRELCKKLCQLLEDERVAYDINGYRNAPPGLRIWAGPTVEADDIKDLLPWLEWAIKSLIK